MRPDLKLQMISVGRHRQVRRARLHQRRQAESPRNRSRRRRSDDAGCGDGVEPWARAEYFVRADSDLGGPQEQRRLRDDARVVRAGRATTSTSRRSNASSASRARGWSSGQAAGLKVKVKSRKSKVKQSRKSMSPEVAQLVAILDQAYNKPSWHGTNLRGSLRRVTPAQAAWRPAAAAPQHLGNRRPCGLLEIRGGAPLHRRRTRIVSAERVELVSPAGAEPGALDAIRRGRPISSCSTTCTTTLRAAVARLSAKDLVTHRRQARRSAISRSSRALPPTISTTPDRFSS